MLCSDNQHHAFPLHSRKSLLLLNIRHLNSSSLETRLSPTVITFKHPSNPTPTDNLFFIPPSILSHLATAGTSDLACILTLHTLQRKWKISTYLNHSIALCSSFSTPFPKTYEHRIQAQQFTALITDGIVASALKKLWHFSIKGTDVKFNPFRIEIL